MYFSRVLQLAPSRCPASHQKLDFVSDLQKNCAMHMGPVISHQSPITEKIITQRQATNDNFFVGHIQRVHSSFQGRLIIRKFLSAGTPCLGLWPNEWWSRSFLLRKYRHLDWHQTDIANGVPRMGQRVQNSTANIIPNLGHWTKNLDCRNRSSQIRWKKLHGLEIATNSS